MRTIYLEFLNKILFLLFVFVGFFTFAQIPPIMVCNASGNTCAPYTSLDDAYTNANSGDYIYLPGGTFTITKNIDKEIHIMGAGFDTNGTPATGITSISGDFNLVDGSNNSSFEGFYLTGNFANSFNNSNDPSPYESKYIIVKSCNINAFNGKFTFSKVINCVTRNMSNFFYGKNNEILNSGIHSIRYLENSLISNCVIYSAVNLWWSYIESLPDVNNSTIKNTYVAGDYNHLGSFSNNSVNNNIVAVGGVFTTGNYSYSTTDWHMKPDGAGHNAGDDGTDIGIYGGSTPWKEGAVPSNPHIFFKSISNTTDGSGNLPVQIKVSAQN